MSDVATDLKLIALDGEDLAVVSAHVQDAFVRREEMKYLAAQKRFALGASRYDWTATPPAARSASARCFALIAC